MNLEQIILDLIKKKKNVDNLYLNKYIKTLDYSYSWLKSTLRDLDKRNIIERVYLKEVIIYKLK